MDNKKIILFQLPFWTPLIPPLGLANLKGYLSGNNFDVKTYDANIEEEYKLIYNKYFDHIKNNISKENRGNIYSIGTDVLRNHLMAYINKTNENDYCELVKLLIYQIFSYNADEKFIDYLNSLIKIFYEWEELYIRRIVEAEHPEFVGVSVKKDTLPASFFAFRLIKEINPDIKTIMGGPVFSEQLTIDSPNFKYFFDKTKQYIDRYIVGQGEELLLKCLKNEFPDDKKVLIQTDIEKQTSFSCLDVNPDFSDFNMDLYPYTGVMGSIGCFYNCTFCNVVSYFGKYSQKPVSKIVDEMQRIQNAYENQVFFMCDNMVNTFVSELSDEIYNRRLSLYWSVYFRVEPKAKRIEEVIKWRGGGMYQVRIGIDSGSQRILDIMGKSISLDESRIMLMNMASVGIKTTTYWLIGHPGETEEDFQQTLDYLTEMKDYIWEAECEYFNYNYSGQSNSGKWADKRKLLFPEKYKEMIWIDKWIVDGEPSWEVIFQRVRRFTLHCEKLGIPNPYSLGEIIATDERWKKLHKNAVPALVDLMSKRKTINENLNFSNISNASTNRMFEMDVEF